MDRALIALSVAAPLLLAIAELFHPQPDDVLRIGSAAWMSVHYLQIPLFPLAAWSAAFVVRGQGGFFAAASRVALFVFAVSFVAFDTAAGVVTGVLSQAAQASGTPEAWRPALMAIWAHPIIGGAQSPAPALAVMGSIAWNVALITAAIVVRRAGGSWVVVVLLIVSAMGLSVFKTHAWPGGPITFAALATAAAVHAWQRSRLAR